MFRILSVLAVVAGSFAQNGTQCGGTTGFPCPTATMSPFPNPSYNTTNATMYSMSVTPAPRNATQPSGSPTPARTPAMTPARTPVSTPLSTPQASLPPTTCCDPTKMQCPAGAPLCGSPPPPNNITNTTLTRCCDAVTGFCVTTNLTCGISVMTTNNTLFQCCPPQMSCYIPMPTCPDCCDPKLFQCPTDAPLCGVAPSPSVVPPPPAPSASVVPPPPAPSPSVVPPPPTQCCDPNTGARCDNTTIRCPVVIPTLNNTLFTCCPAGANCGRDLPVCPQCCDTTIFACPASAPICVRPSSSSVPIPAKCCDALANVDCPLEQVIAYGICLPTLRNTTFTCCPQNITCSKPFPTCPECCDPNVFPCPADAPLCVAPSPLPSQRPPVDPSPSLVAPSQPAVSFVPPPQNPSAPPTQPPAPSLLPSKSSAPTARPTQIVAASALPTARPTTFAVATQYFRASRTPAPSRSAIPPSFTPAAYIPVLNAAITIPGGNATSAVQPTNLQMTQANLACALGVPQQSIQIRNITIKYVNGTRVMIPFDPAVAQLNSGTDVVCMTTATGGAVNRTLRGGRMMQQQTYTIEISYDIVDPPLVILAMDPTTFSATITNNTIMIDLVSALGGTSVAAEAPQELASGLSAAPSSAPSSSNTISISDAQMMMYGGIGAAIAVLAVVVAATAFFIGRSQRRVTPTTPEPTRVVYVVDNPLSKSPDVSVDYKNTYAPSTIRR